MKTGKRIAVGLAAALAIAIFAAGAVSMVGAQLTEQLVFTVGVSAFNVSIDTIHDIDFDQMLPGQETEMHSFDLINEGDIKAMVEARFLTQYNGVYGFTGGSVISAENFTINDIALDSDGIAMEICTVQPGETKEFHTKLRVPLDQAGADYSGTVELIFSIPTHQP